MSFLKWLITVCLRNSISAAVQPPKVLKNRHISDSNRLLSFALRFIPSLLLPARSLGDHPDALAVGDAFVAVEIPVATANSGTIRGADAGMFPFHHGIITIIVLVAGMKDRSDRKGRENDQCLHDVKVDR